MTTNLGSIDRLFRLLLGFALIAIPTVSGLAMFDNNWAIVASVLAGSGLVATAALKFCPLYRTVGLRTCRA